MKFAFHVLGCLAIITIVQPTPLDAGQVLFLAPCALIAVASAWSASRIGAQLPRTAANKT